MPFDNRSALGPKPRKRVAVVGSGVSGLSAAWLLSGAHDIVLYESDGRLGGHANTVMVPTAGGPTPVDAGFIVFNRPSYPNLAALLETLGVGIDETCMSFAVSLDGGRIEYCGRNLSSVFANRAHIASPSHWAMLFDVARFHREARRALDGGVAEDVSLAAFARSRGFSKAFLKRFLEPMASAIWSTPSDRILNYPAAALFRFYDNHGLLQVLGLPAWNTVRGGSRSYVARIAEIFSGEVRLNAPVLRIERGADGVSVIDARGGRDRFDDAVIAAHADHALGLLAEPTARERATLGAFRYQPNRAVMHFDAAQMPTRRRAWASWNYLGGAGAPSVTYWMNSLQNLTCKEEIFVTLNPAADIRADKVIARFDYDHPMFDVAAGRAQRELWSLQGEGGVWFCGSYFGQGFHEDGLQSGLAVAEALGGVRRPWSVPGESARIHLNAAARLAAE